MSLNQKISSLIENHIDSFIKQISNSHGIDKDELWELWSGEKKNKPPESSLNPTELNKLLLSDIKVMCKERGIKSSGTKKILISLLCGEDPSDSEPNVVKNKPKTKENTEPPVLKKISASIPVISIHRNKFGNSEHSETSFVFDKTKKVYGKQNSDGTIDELTEEDIDICNKYKFSYVLPSNLDKSSGLEDTKVEELDEEIDSDEEDLDEDELLEEEEEEELLEEDEDEF